MENKQEDIVIGDQRFKPIVWWESILMGLFDAWISGHWSGNPSCGRVIKRLIERGDKIILLDYGGDGVTLNDAVQCFTDRDIPLSVLTKIQINIGRNQTRRIAHKYIDDASIGSLINPV